MKYVIVHLTGTIGLILSQWNSVLRLIVFDSPTEFQEASIPKVIRCTQYYILNYRRAGFNRKKVDIKPYIYENNSDFFLKSAVLKIRV